MPEHELKVEINQVKGALDVLGLLRERLQSQREEIGTESAQEVLDEIVTQVDALLLEYQHRRTALYPLHQSFQFILSELDVYPLVHDCYVDLVRGKAISTEFAGQTLRLGDWYVRMQDNVPKEVVNETYSWLVLDEFGRADLHAAKAIKSSPLPTGKMRQQIYNKLFASAL